MDAKSKLNKLVTTTLGLVTYVMEGFRKPSGRLADAPGGPYQENPREKAPELVRVTDSAGEEYLCPVSAAADRNFVDESKKHTCFDYGAISKHAVEY